MLSLQNSLIEWFKQFADNIYVVGDEYLIDPSTGGQKLKPLPLISFSYATSDFDGSTLMTFNIWSQSFNWTEVLSIENKIAKALPSKSNVTFDITTGTVYEYRNPSTGLWIEFDLADVQRIAQEMWNEYGQQLDWREIPGESRGGIVLRRGSPFTQSVADPDFLIKRRMGNIEIKSFTIY